MRREEDLGGESRFSMLETVHEYASERLAERGEAEKIRQAHAEYYLALAEKAEPELKDPGQLEWMQRLEAEHDDMRAALEGALRAGEAELMLRLRGAL